MTEKKTTGLWRKNGIPGGKYLVQRRDGSVPDWPYFVIGAQDPSAPAALRAYAEDARQRGLDPKYIADIEKLATEFEEYRDKHGNGDPDAVPHRTDDPEVVARMKNGA